MSSWLGASVLGLGEWFIKRIPFVRHIYNASKQISSAISPDQNTQAFKEVAIIRHPRIGEYAFGFITSSVTLQTYSGEEDLCCVYVPTNHLYIGDIFLVNSKDVIRPNLSVREGIGIPIGVVTTIAAPASIKVDFEGDGGHAGAALMPNRNDAGLAAAELALAVEKHVLESGSIDTVGTVGILDLHPRAVNSIPSKAHVEIDTRDINETRRNIIVEKIHQSAVDIAKKRSCS